MTRAEWIEVLVIAVLAPISWLVLPHISAAMPFWKITLGLSSLLLGQSLVRDIAILLRNRSSASNQPRREAQCFCLESTIGTTGVVTGTALAIFGRSTQVEIGRSHFLLAVAGTMVLGFAIKDLVISWKPFGIRREKDHLNIIVRWKSNSK